MGVTDLLCNSSSGKRLFSQEAVKTSSLQASQGAAMEPRQVLTTILLSVLIIILASATVGEDDPNELASNCCTKLNIASECHFLCGVGKVGFWTTTRWKCTHKYYAKVATCKVQNKIDYFKLFGQQFSQAVKNGFDKLSSSLQKKLTSAVDFVKVTVEELKQIPQDVLSSLQESLEGMTGIQFGSLVKRLVTFTSQNLRNLVSHVKLQSFFDNVDKLAAEKWSLEQRSALMKAVHRKFGDRIIDWTKEALITVRELMTGLSSGDLAQIVGDVFKQGVQFICKLNFSKDQKNALMIPARAAYGDVSDWDETVARKLCQLLEGLPVGEILKLTSKTIANAIDVFAKNNFTFPQAKVLIAKLKEEWKDIESWSEGQLQKVGNLLKDFNVEDFKSLLKDQFKAIVKILGQFRFSLGKGRVLINKAIDTYGTPDKWSVDDIKDLGNLTASLLPSELRQIGSQVLKPSLKYIKDGDFGVDQAQAIVEKLKSITSVSKLDKDDLVSLAKMIDGFLASDIGQMVQIVVFTAFPELTVVKKVGFPIVRALIKKYEQDKSSNKNIGMLGNYATGLSRAELDDISVDSVIVNLDKIGLIPWDKTQVLELAKKVHDRWGSFNGTEDDESDSPTWGFRNFRKLGKIVLGIAKEELGDLPIRGIEDTIEALGQQRGWDRGQVRMILKRLREYWEMENLDFSNFTEVDLNAMGTLVQGLAQEELKLLPEKVLLVAIKRLGEETGLPEDKLKARAYIAVEYIKNQTGTDLLNATHISDLGNLVSGLNKKALGKITKNAFVQNLYTIARADGFSRDKLKEIAKLAKKHFDESDVRKWLGEQWRDLGPAVVGLEPSDLRRISKKAFDEVLDELGTLDFDTAQARALVAAAKEAWDEDDLGKWTGEQLRQLGSLVKGLDASDIRRISKDAFEEAVGAWGERLDIDVDTLKALATQAKEYLATGDASKLTAVMLKKLGRVVLGLQPEDLEKLKLDNVDIVAALGQWKEWSPEQLKRLEPKVREFLRQSGLDDDVYMSLGQLALSLNKDDLKKIGKKAFSIAIKHLGEIDAWSDEQCGALINKAKSVWSKTSNQWDKVDISELGNALKCLSTVDIPKLKAQFLDVVLPKVIASMSVKQLQAFTPAQFEAMETPQVQAISAAKRSYLTVEQNDAIQAVIQRDPDEPDPWGPDDEDECHGSTCSGAGQQVSFVSLVWVLPIGMLLHR